MTWIISKQFTFEAAHQLPEHDGKCRKLHGHSWKGTVFVGGNELHQTGAKQGMVMDYTDVKAVISPIIEEKLDHCFLNETLPLANPTSEAIAEWLYHELKDRLPIIGVLINETCTSSCFYCPHQFNLSIFNGVLG